MSLLGEVRRRKVFQVAAVYAVVAWLIIQIVGAIEAPLSLPEWLDTVVIVLLAVGFPLAVILAWAFELTPAGLVRDEGGASSTSANRLGIEIVLGVLLVVALGWIAYREIGSSEVAPQAAAAPAAPEDDGHSVAVLPFQNLSLDDENAFFAAGIHEEVLNQLAKLSDLRVISRTSVLRFEDSDLSIPEIAGQLNVRTVLEGSVRYDNERVRIAAQLIDAATDEHVWSEIYERDMADIFAIQADIAMNIANALAAEFSPEEQESIEAAPTESIEAYELYLSALAAYRTNSAQRGLGLVERALDIDPEFARAWALKADLHLTQLLGTPENEAPAVHALAEQAAQRALALDPDLAAVHGTLAQVAAWRRDWLTAEAEFRAVRALDSNAGARHFFFLLVVGKVNEALPYLERERTRDPLNASLTVFLAGQRLISGDTAAARAELDRGFERFANANGNWVLGMVQLTLLELGEGNFDTFRSLTRAAGTAAAFSDLDDPDALHEDLRRLIASEGNFALLGVAAAAAAALGDYELALEAQDRAISAVGTGTWDLWKPVYREMRRQHGFNELVEKHGLVEYWREYGWPDLCRPLGDQDFECF